MTTYIFVRGQVNYPIHSTGFKPFAQTFQAFCEVLEVMETQADDTCVEVVEVVVIQQRLVFFAALTDDVWFAGQ